MKKLYRFFSFPILISEITGLILFILSAYTLNLLINKEALKTHLQGAQFPQQLADIEVICANCFMELWSFATGAYIITALTSVVIAILKKPKVNRLYLNALILTFLWIPIIRSPLEESLFQIAYAVLTFIIGNYVNLNLVVLAIFFLASGLFFLLINTNFMKRTILKALKKPFFGRFMVPWRNPLSEEERKNWKPIRVRSKTGAEIQLLWYQQENARGTIVLGHPMGKAAKGVFLKNSHTQRLIEKGFNVMLYDFNGFGESQMGNFNFYDDAEAVAIKAKALSPGLRLGYHGISLGGMWICPVLSRKTNPFGFIILESAATTLPEFWKHYPLAHKVLRFSFLFMPKHAEYLKPINHVRNLEGVKKLLLIYSDTDEYTPLEMGERFRASTNTNVELWNASGADHALAYKRYGEVYWDKVIGFFDNQFYKE